MISAFFCIERDICVINITFMQHNNIEIKKKNIYT